MSYVLKVPCVLHDGSQSYVYVSHGAVSLYKRFLLKLCGISVVDTLKDLHTHGRIPDYEVMPDQKDYLQTILIDIREIGKR